jgi:ferritin-like protein
VQLLKSCTANEICNIKECMKICDMTGQLVA